MRPMNRKMNETGMRWRKREKEISSASNHHPFSQFRQFHFQLQTICFNKLISIIMIECVCVPINILQSYGCCRSFIISVRFVLFFLFFPSFLICVTKLVFWAKFSDFTWIFVAVVGTIKSKPKPSLTKLCVQIQINQT